MFADLMDKSIQPEEIRVGIIPDITISEKLISRINAMFEEEEGGFTKIEEKISIVQTDKSYVFFSNQWFYLAVLCKKYADSLYEYCEFFDKILRTDSKAFDCLRNKAYDDMHLKSLFESDNDLEKMILFIEGGSGFRPGKSLLNDGGKVRSCKDIFGSCILGKLSVPNASSAYLGNLVYYLSKHPEIYDELENEIKRQTEHTTSMRKLPSIAKQCAKEIFDLVYKIDSFERLKDVLEINDSSIKINTSSIRNLDVVGNFLRYVFIRPSSDMYQGTSMDAESSGKKPRVFDRVYAFDFEDESIDCKLTTEWKDADPTAGNDGNYLNVLIKVINEKYSKELEILEIGGERYFRKLVQKFTVPDQFSDDYSKRFITSLLAKQFVILTGNSGAGKTRIAKRFSQYLEVKFADGEKNWELVPVGADWTDNTKLLGFYNPLAENGSGKYEETSVTKLISRANLPENKYKPFFLILDEMNLSHVERYFADFLSHMETPDVSFVLDGYDGELKFPRNLYVVGTVNIDETTYMFSPKVLDRANVIEFKPEKESVLNLFVKDPDADEIHAVDDGSAEAFYKLTQTIQDGCCNEEVQLEDVRKLFDQLYIVTEKYGYEFAYRTVKEIRNYIVAAYELSEPENFNLTQAEDEQVLQKILPKIHGNRKEIGSMLDELIVICDEHDLKLSRKKIEQMKGKLANTQYASFI